MGDAIGVDLGTTYTAAAVARAGDADAVEIVELGTRTASVPSLVYLCDDGSVLTGEAAERRGADDPSRLARDVKRRMGDTTAVLLGGSPLSVDALMARQLASVVATITERRGSAPTTIAITHPANWGSYKLDLLRQAVSRADLRSETVLVSEPHAAAIHYSAEHPLEHGEPIVIYDLGGGTFDVAVMRSSGTDFELLGEPEGI